MSTVLSSPSENSITDSWSKSIGDVPEDAECLAIAPNDPALLEALAKAVDCQPSAVLTTTDQETAFDGEIVEQIKQTIEANSIRHVIVVGCSSHAAAPNEATDEDAQANDFATRVLLGTQAQTAANQAHQAQFTEQFQQLVSDTAIDSKCKAGILKVSGLFHRACDGTFLLYDPESKELHPLVVG